MCFVRAAVNVGSLNDWSRREGKVVKGEGKIVKGGGEVVKGQ